MKILKQDIEEVKRLLNALTMRIEDTTNYVFFAPLAEEVSSNSTTAMIGDIVMTNTSNRGVSASVKPGLVLSPGKDSEVTIGFAQLDYQYQFPLAEAMEIGAISASTDVSKLLAYDIYLVPDSSVLVKFKI